MKLIFLIFTLAALLQVSFAAFGNHKNMLKEDMLHREPPVRQTAMPFNTFDTIYEGWMRTSLDQFDPLNNQTYFMRYLMNKEHLVEGGPIFIFVGGEWTISPSLIQNGHMYDMARNLSGMMIYSEHRYYGFSTPTPDLTLENMQYLNIDQALADLAHFIVNIKENFPEVKNSSVILVGCSYSGTMVTWFMQKYPHLAQGAWSMSAPLKAKVDFVEYMETVSKAIHDIGGAACSSKIRNAFVQMENLWENKNITELERIFRLCRPLNVTNTLDVWNLFGDMGSAWSGIVQYASRYGQEIETNCADLLAIEANSDIEAYAEWVFNRWRLQGCNEHRWEAFLYWYGGIEWDSYAAQTSMRQWLYQTCAEYGWYQSSGSEDILFGSMFPVELSLQFCKDLYDNL